MSGRRAPRRRDSFSLSDSDGGGEDRIDDLDGLERVDATAASGAASKRRKKSTAAGGQRGRKKRRVHSNADADAAGDGDEAAAAAGGGSSALASSIRSKAAQLGLGSMGMSRIARAEHDTHLSYFDQIAAPAKSKNTLKDVAKITPEDRARISASLPVRLSSEKDRLFAYHRSQMREWYLQMRAGGYNLLAYGLGSKKKLISEFARTWLTDGPVVVMNGYYPAANVKSVRQTKSDNTMGYSFLRHDDTTFHQPECVSFESWLEFVRDWFRNDARMALGGRRGRITKNQEYTDSESEEEENATHAAAASSSSSSAFLPRVYIVIHNIDGASLRSEVQQQVLALLASIPQLQFVVSVDHILSGWLWDQSLLNQFNFVHHDCTTYASYSHEFLFSSGEVSHSTDLVDSSASGRAGGIVNVLASLTPNHRKVLDVLATEQLTSDNPNFVAGTQGAILRSTFLNLCEENMLVANAASFDRLLSELRDHNLVDEKVVNKCRIVSIPYPALVIRKHILNECIDEDAIAAAAAEAAEAQHRHASRADENAFARAIGAEGGNDQEEEEEEDDE